MHDTFDPAFFRDAPAEVAKLLDPPAIDTVQLRLSPMTHLLKDFSRTLSAGTVQVREGWMLGVAWQGLEGTLGECAPITHRVASEVKSWEL